ncbi:nuclear transport factor 2 family protein [Hymenobacter endophyticus]|uniref:Nuclear transport factor 2 family protein n=1 Tax=Hymenobacter endophyticus TaxID=3076335 RepID=A0ABU3TKG3_9BACT|nr:nuclear transport factor 2 family protein [Hymenobacter endophyticus]MDU0371867.1 nuclear transport factor 2 family protein [Hymenobacter endophyticus]
MKAFVLGLGFVLLGVQGTYAQQKGGSAAPAKTALVEQQIRKLSQDKWRWMAERKADTLAVLFDDKAMFVHMGGSWGKKQELDVIRSGSIHYKQADVEETSVQIIDNTAILLSKIRLLAVLGGNEVTNPFIVTEVYVREKGKWKLGSLSFTKLLTP